MFGLGFVDSTK